MDIVTDADADLWLNKYIVLPLNVFPTERRDLKITSKNVKKHKRIRRKCNYDKNIEINPTWSMYV